VPAENKLSRHPQNLKENKMKTLRTTFITLIMLITLFAANAWAGPFGLEMGMHLKDVSVNQEIKYGQYVLNRVPQPHPSFSLYSVRIAPKAGLFEIITITDSIKTNSFGDGLRNKYEFIRNKLTKKYGVGKEADILKDGSIWSNPQDFTMALKAEEYLLATLWDREGGATLPDGVTSVILECKGGSPNAGIVRLEYSFSNKDAALEELNNKTDGAL